MKHKLRAMVLLCAVLSAFSQSDGLTEQEKAMIEDALIGLFYCTYSLEIPYDSLDDKDLRPVIFTADNHVGKEQKIRVNIAKSNVYSLRALLSGWWRRKLTDSI